MGSEKEGGGRDRRERGRMERGDVRVDEKDRVQRQEWREGGGKGEEGRRRKGGRKETSRAEVGRHEERERKREQRYFAETALNCLPKYCVNCLPNCLPELRLSNCFANFLPNCRIAC